MTPPIAAAMAATVGASEAALYGTVSESLALTMSSRMRAMPTAAIQSVQTAAGHALQSARDITDSALELIGVRYKFGGQSPERGMDCSGFVRYVFEQVTGVTLPRSARDQAKVGESVDLDELKPGDLVFFNTRKHAYSHVGIYLGDNTFIHSPNKKGSVRVTSIDGRYWKHRFDGARRLLGVLPGLASIEAAKAVLKSLPTGAVRNDDAPD
jgi:cell wall-associated NlpC family hydrolase